MSWKRYLVHLSVLGLLGTAAAFANPFAATVYEGVTYGDVWAVDRPSAGVVSVQQRTLQLEAEIREMKRAYRQACAQNPVAAPAVAFDPRWLDLDVEEEVRLLQEEQFRFLADLAASEARAAAACLDTR